MTFSLQVEKGVKQRMNSEQRSLSNRVNFQQKVAMQKQVACESPGEGAKKVAPVVVNSVIDSQNLYSAIETSARKSERFEG